ncbi:hypothetical protein AB0L35_35380 [Streptomyces sp. NPDC052309]|uniref:baeRF2 domain-containing protein n=1 Tax=Streptomyces sp. NPDC052309 TaxID=3155421 RepID=UPI0034144C75
MDLQFLRPLYEGDEPVASVHLDTSRGVHDADKQIELRLRAACRSLADQGADEATLAALEEAAGGAPGVPGPQGEALFASDGRLLGAHTMAEPPATDHSVLSPVPDPLPLVIDRDHQLPHVVAVVDREGADVDGFPAAAHEPSFRRTFNGSTLHITRVRAGREAHASYHRRSVNLWTENTAQVADDIRAAASDVDAAVIVIAGDPKAVGLLREHLADRPPTGRIVYVEGGRGDEDAVRASVDAAMTEAMEASHRRVLDELDAQLTGGRALQGIPAVKEALAEGRVETLLMARDRSADPLLLASRRDPKVLATDRAAFGDDPTVFEAPAGMLLLRSAVLGDAGFTELLPPTRCTDGVAALLRY